MFLKHYSVHEKTIQFLGSAYSQRLDQPMIQMTG